MNKIVAAVRNLADFNKIILFGSYAKDEATSESDYDLCFIVNGDLDLDELYINIRKELIECIDVPLDIKIYKKDVYEQLVKSINGLEREIQEHGIAVFG